MALIKNVSYMKHPTFNVQIATEADGVLVGINHSN